MLQDFLFTAGAFASAVILCSLLRRLAEGDGYVGLVFVLTVAAVSRWTEGYFWGTFSSLCGVVCVNYVFTFPYWEFNFTMTGYPLTFLTLLAVSIMISTMTTQIKKQERLRMETEKESMRANLLRAMSHDIRTPLTSIVGNTAAILESNGAFSSQQEHDKVTALDMGADDYIEKPFGTSELLARIRTAIRHTRTSLDNDSIARSGKFSVGGLTIDYDKHRVFVDGEDVHLTLNEFKIVALLGKYAGKVLTYDFLIREIWGPKAKADNQILRVNMANIRRKIEENPADPRYIFTEIGVGYRMLDGEN
ncbi:MAG: DUF4118 domain-containing protein [Eubacteriales bacterium]|nr:DUF4118 domain-containing protein [Eubacteriales bacterium]